MRVAKVATLGTASAHDPSNAKGKGAVAEKNDKVAGKAPPKPDEKPRHETVVAPFDDIIDVILGANPEAIGEHQEIRRRKRKPINR